MTRGVCLFGPTAPLPSSSLNANAGAWKTGSTRFCILCLVSKERAVSAGHSEMRIQDGRVALRFSRRYSDSALASGSRCLGSGLNAPAVCRVISRTSASLTGVGTPRRRPADAT